MKQISLAEAYDLLEHASAVIVNDGALIYPRLADLTGVADNEFLTLNWEDGEDYYICAVEENNQMVTIEDGSLIFVDHEGDEFKLTLLQTIVIA